MWLLSKTIAGRPPAKLTPSSRLAVPRDRIVAGLSSFRSNEVQNPLRMNVFRTQGVTLMVDYAHNAAAYRAIIDTARQLATRRLLV